MLKSILCSAFLVCMVGACDQQTSPAALPVQCATPSECPFSAIAVCQGNTEYVLLDFEPMPYPNLIQCCPYHLDKEPAQNAYISARLDSHKTPWTLSIWSNQRQIVFPATWFCLDEYTGNFHLYKSATGDTLRVALYDTQQVQNYLDNFEQLIFSIEVKCL